jgi:hypothetical protein
MYASYFIGFQRFDFLLATPAEPLSKKAYSDSQDELFFVFDLPFLSFSLFISGL